MGQVLFLLVKRDSMRNWLVVTCVFSPLQVGYPLWNLRQVSAQFDRQQALLLIKQGPHLL